MISEQDLVRNSREGSRESFEKVIKNYSRELFAYCYKMLGSVHDAEDVLQEVLLKAWQAIQSFRGEGSIRNWLYKITSNTCLTFAEKRSRNRVLPFQVFEESDYVNEIPSPVKDPIWVEPLPSYYFDSPDTDFEKKEKLKIAFIIVYQLLNPQQRSIYILRDLLSFSAKETAEILDLSTASVNSSLLRARQKLESEPGKYPEDDVNLTDLDQGIQSLVENFLSCWEKSDIDGIISLMQEDAILSMPPLSIWFKGHAKIKSFFENFIFSKRTKLIKTSANEQLAFAGYRLMDNKYIPHTILLLSISKQENDRYLISNIISFLESGLFSVFQLPESLTL